MTHVILKYPNRKLYSKTRNGYVNFDFLVELLQNDKEFVVLDSETNEEVTREVLARLLSKVLTESRLSANVVKRIVRSAVIETLPEVPYAEK